MARRKSFLVGSPKGVVRGVGYEFSAKEAAIKAAKVGSSITRTTFCVVSGKSKIECWRNGRRVARKVR